MIHSLDGEEAVCTCGARGALADHPCPRCLVYKDNLHMVLRNSPFRTVKAMRTVYKQAMAASTKTGAEEIMRKNGLHKVLVYILYFFLS